MDSNPDNSRLNWQAFLISPQWLDYLLPLLLAEKEIQIDAVRKSLAISHDEVCGAAGALSLVCNLIETPDNLAAAQARE